VELKFFCKLSLVWHGSFDGMLWSQNRAVKNGNEDDGHKGVSSGELGRIHGQGDTRKRVRGRDGNGSFGRLFGIKFELDFHCRGLEDGQ
jgi:hypothetical protein